MVQEFGWTLFLNREINTRPGSVVKFVTKKLYHFGHVVSLGLKHK